MTAVTRQPDITKSAQSVNQTGHIYEIAKKPNISPCSSIIYPFTETAVLYMMGIQ